MRVTLFDVLILLAVFGGGFYGFSRGFFSQAVGTISIYISTVISTLSYRGLSRLLSGSTGQPSLSTDMLAFILLMVVIYTMFVLLGRELTMEIDIETMGIWVNLGGMIFGLINTVLLCALLLIIIRSGTADKWYGYDNFRLFLYRQTYGSWMAFTFQPAMRLLLITVKPWMFGGELPRLLKTL